MPFRIDHLFFGNVFGDEYDGVNFMAPSAALLFISLASVQMLYLLERFIWLAEVLLYLSFLCSLFLLCGFLFHVPEFNVNSGLFPASQSCVLFLFLCWAIAFSRPQQGFVGLMITDLEGSRIGRYLFPFTFGVPLVITIIRFILQQNHHLSFEFGIASVALLYFLIFMVALFFAVLSLNAKDSQRINHLTKIKELNEELTRSNEAQRILNRDLTAYNQMMRVSGLELHNANKELTTINDRLAVALATIKEQDEIIIKQKDEALKRSQQYLQIIFDSTEEKILLLDKEARIVLYNNGVLRFMEMVNGSKPQTGKYLWDIHLPKQVEMVKQLFARAIAGERIKQEIVISLPTGKVFHLLSYEPVRVNGVIEYVTLIGTDITAEKLVSEKLTIQNQELQKTNHELDSFVYSVSHDLRAPLSTVLGLISVAEMENNSNELPYLVLIKERINHLDKFIKNILDFSRNARTQIKSEEIDFKKLIEETQKSLTKMNGFDSLAITLQQKTSAPFYSDPVRLGIIFTNLITNAIKFQDYHKPQSNLTIIVETVGDEVHLVFKDNGIGILSEHQVKVFEMFYRGTDRASGSGIGLYIVKETVDKLKGRITLQSMVDQFTQFDVYLPNIDGSSRWQS